jgi:sugar O-acyltransferase (sialic acid O-acetyltransferase NeuD family)
MQRYIYGAGGHGKVVLDAMQVSKLMCNSFIDDKFDLPVWCGLPVIKLIDFNLDQELHLAIGSCKARELIAYKLKTVTYFSVVHPKAIVAQSSVVQVGTLLAANSIVAPDTQVGKHCIINHCAIVDHDCIVGDFCHIAPNACLGGGVILGKCVFVGAGAVILPGIKVADYATIGAGAMVNKNVQKGLTVIGCPAKSI